MFDPDTGSGGRGDRSWCLSLQGHMASEIAEAELVHGGGETWELDIRQDAMWAFSRVEVTESARACSYILS